MADNSERSQIPLASNPLTPYDMGNWGEWYQRKAVDAEIERLTRGMNGQADVIVQAQRELAAALIRVDELERANVGLATESERRRAALATARTAILHVDDLLSEAGYAVDSSARNLLMCGCPDAALSGEHSAPETSPVHVHKFKPYVFRERYKALRCACGAMLVEPSEAQAVASMLAQEAAVCQHDRFKPGFTLQWLGSTPDVQANTHRFQCTICRESFDLAIGEAQLNAQKADGEPT